MKNKYPLDPPPAHPDSGRESWRHYPNHGRRPKDTVEVPVVDYEKMMEAIRLAREVAGDTVGEVSRLRSENRALKEMNSRLQAQLLDALAVTEHGRGSPSPAPSPD